MCTECYNLTATVPLLIALVVLTFIVSVLLFAFHLEGFLGSATRDYLLRSQTEKHFPYGAVLFRVTDAALGSYQAQWTHSAHFLHSSS